MFKTSSVVAILSLTACMNAYASPTSCKTLDKKQATALFERWNQSLQSGDAKKVAANYTPDAVLLATLSNTPRTDLEGKVDYFEHFLANKPKGHIDSTTLVSSCNSAIDSGTYTFRFADDSTVNARYTFSYALIDNQWLITSHHSSAMPE
ncbi:SgcJ/EcaC family oxidoreductase [Pseudomonas abietaniphila]|jgi:uncharacterized protein (TIGR02246 family)